MGYIRLKFLLTNFIFMLFVGLVNLKAQEFKLNTKTAEISDNKIVVKYDFTTFNQNQTFYVWLEIKNSNGTKINVKTVSGDLGKNIKGGKNKQIIWNFINDKILIDDEIGIEVIAKLISNEETNVVTEDNIITTEDNNTDDEIIDDENVMNNKPEKTFSTGKVLLLSAVLPGMGITKIKQKYPYLALSLVAYGTAAMSYLYNNKAYNNYSEYLNNETVSTESDYFSKSKSQKSMSNIFIYTAAATWTANMIWTFIAASKKNNSTTDLKKTSKINFSANFNPYYKIPELVFIYKF